MTRVALYELGASRELAALIEMLKLAGAEVNLSLVRVRGEIVFRLHYNCEVKELNE